MIPLDATWKKESKYLTQNSHQFPKINLINRRNEMKMRQNLQGTYVDTKKGNMWLLLLSNHQLMGFRPSAQWYTMLCCNISFLLEFYGNVFLSPSTVFYVPLQLPPVPKILKALGCCLSIGLARTEICNSHFSFWVLFPFFEGSVNWFQVTHFSTSGDQVTS